MPEKYMIPLKVRNYHIDSYGHVNNAQYLILLEEARTQFMDDINCPLEDFIRQGLYITVIDIHIRFRKPAVLGDRLEVFIWLPVMKRAQAIFKQEIRLAVSGDLIASAEVTCACVKNGRPTALPAEFLKVMEPYQAPAGHGSDE